MTALRDALVRVAAENGMPKPQGGVVGGGWQWLWYASGNPDRAYRIDVSAEPGPGGITVSGHSLTLNRRGERDPAGETWYSHYYPFAESRSDIFAEHLTVKLKTAWQSAVEASAAAS